MPDKNVTTVVFHSGYTIQFHIRDDNPKRFKVYSSYVLERFKEKHPHVYYDDCSGEELAEIIRFVANM